MAQNSFTPIINSTKNNFAHWSKLNLSWMGRVVTVKMMILPWFLFVFQNPLVKIQNHLLQQIQIIINKFIWNEKKPRIKISALQQETRKGNLGVPNIKLYYCAAHLAAIWQWWIPHIRTNWSGKHIGIPIPLSEWMLLSAKDRGN